MYVGSVSVEEGNTQVMTSSDKFIICIICAKASR